MLILEFNTRVIIYIPANELSDFFLWQYICKNFQKRDCDDHVRLCLDWWPDS